MAFDKFSLRCIVYVPIMSACHYKGLCDSPGVNVGGDHKLSGQTRMFCTRKAEKKVWVIASIASLCNEGGEELSGVE